MDDVTRAGLFSGIATLTNQAGQTVILPGPSLLMSLVLSMEADAPHLEKKGCISKTRVSMLYATNELAGIYKGSQVKDFPNYSDDFKQDIAFFSGLTEDGGIPALKAEYTQCEKLEFFLYSADSYTRTKSNRQSAPFEWDSPS